MRQDLSLIPVFVVLALVFVWSGRERAHKDNGREKPKQSAPLANFASWDVVARAIQGKAHGDLVLGRSGFINVHLPSTNSLLIFGPTRSGKTTRLAVPLLREFDGPAVVTSVKRDLLSRSLPDRQDRGEYHVFDLSGEGSSTWNIFSLIDDFNGAKEVSDALCRVSKGVRGELDFWSRLASKMLAPLLLAAKESQYTLSTVLRWVESQDFDGVFEVLSDGSQYEARSALEAVIQLDQRTLSSVVATLLSFLEPFGNSTISDLLSIDGLDLAKILDRNAANTLYICSPLFKAERFYGIYEIFIRKVLEISYASSSSESKILFLFDELANVAPIGDLDKVASTCGGFGIVLVSIFQDLSQLDAVYGIQARTVVNNHRSKLFLSGISDSATMGYVNLISSELEKKVNRRVSLADIRRGEALLMNSDQNPMLIRLRSRR